MRETGVLFNKLNLRAFRLFYQNWWMGKPVKPPYRHVVQIGDPVLRQKARPLDPSEINKPETIQLFSRMKEMLEKCGCAGISAPQLGVSLRIIAFHFPSIREYKMPGIYRNREMQEVRFQIWVNPEMKVLDYDKITFDECCESIKGYTADVPRYRSIQLTGLNEKGEKKEMVAKGWTARIIQHEMDHLNGLLFTDIMAPKSLACTNWEVINRKQGRIYITFFPEK